MKTKVTANFVCDSVLSNVNYGYFTGSLNFEKMIFFLIWRVCSLDLIFFLLRSGCVFMDTNTASSP